MPKKLMEEKEVTCKEWFDTVTAAMQGEVEIKEESDEIIIAVCKGSKEKELFPLKMRDAGSSAGYQMLLKKGLIPQDGMLPRRQVQYYYIWACFSGCAAQHQHLWTCLPLGMLLCPLCITQRQNEHSSRHKNKGPGNVFWCCWVPRCLIPSR
jgi:hypothetical protein